MGIKHSRSIIVFILFMIAGNVLGPNIMAEEFMSEEERGEKIEGCTRACLSKCPGQRLLEITNICKETVLLGTMLFQYPVSMDYWRSYDNACKIQCNSYASNNGFSNDTEAIDDCISNCKCVTDCARQKGVKWKSL